MSNEEIFGAYVLPAIVSLVAAAAAFLGNQLKRLYEKYINDKTKQFQSPPALAAHLGQPPQVPA